MIPSPEAVIDDGIFDICYISSLSKIKIFSCFPKLINGTHGSLKQVTFFKGKKLKIACSKPFYINIDGEIIQSKKAVIKILPKFVNLIFPNK